jgi:hypothetical protein
MYFPSLTLAAFPLTRFSLQLQMLADTATQVFQNLHAMNTKHKHPGRPPLAPHVVQIVVRVPGALLLRVESVALDELCAGRSAAARLLLERGLGVWS